MPVLVIERIDVNPERVEALVRVPPGEPMRTSNSSGLVERAVELLPGLSRHTCDNGSAHGILGELADTEIPHLLEHVAFELMALAGSPRTLRGETVVGLLGGRARGLSSATRIRRRPCRARGAAAGGRGL